jgi:hypothetical protein
MSEHSALAFYYFMSICHLVEGGFERLGLAKIESAGHLVFEVDAPITEFGDLPIANIDVPLLLLAKMLKRNGQADFATTDLSVVLGLHGNPLFFELTVEGGNFELISAINPQFAAVSDQDHGAEKDEPEEGDDDGEENMQESEENDT